MRYRNDGPGSEAHTGVVRLAPSVTVAEILSRRPGAFRVFLRNGMACVGCFLAAFETVGDAADEYGLDVRRLLREIEKETKR